MAQDVSFPSAAPSLSLPAATESDTKSGLEALLGDEPSGSNAAETTAGELVVDTRPLPIANLAQVPVLTPPDDAAAAEGSNEPQLEDSEQTEEPDSATDAPSAASDAAIPQWGFVGSTPVPDSFKQPGDEEARRPPRDEPLDEEPPDQLSNAYEAGKAHLDAGKTPEAALLFQLAHALLAFSQDAHLRTLSAEVLVAAGGQVPGLIRDLKPAQALNDQSRFQFRSVQDMLLRFLIARIA